MTTKTTYKVLAYRGTLWLQYLKLYKFLFFKWYEWEHIPYPNESDKPQFVCNKILKYTTLKKFIIEYPDIDDYLKNEYVERKNKFKKAKHK